MMTIHVSKDAEVTIKAAIRSGLFSSADDMVERLVSEYAHRSQTQPSPAGQENVAGGEETAYDVASRAGLIGCVQSAPRSPTDLSTNPRHMEGFGRG